MKCFQLSIFDKLMKIIIIIKNYKYNELLKQINLNNKSFKKKNKNLKILRLDLIIVFWFNYF